MLGAEASVLIGTSLLQVGVNNQRHAIFTDLAINISNCVNLPLVLK